MKRSLKSLVSLLLASSLFFAACNMSTDETPPGDITDLVVIPKGEAVEFNWKNPGDTDFSEVEIKVVSKDSNVSIMKTVVVTGKATSCVVEELVNNVEYAFVFTALDTSKNRSEGITASAVPQGLGNVKLIDLNMMQGEALLRWRNPKDKKFAGVHIQIINNDIPVSTEEIALETAASDVKEFGELPAFAESEEQLVLKSQTEESEEQPVLKSEIPETVQSETESAGIEPAETESVETKPVEIETAETELEQLALTETEDSISEEAVENLLRQNSDLFVKPEVKEERVRHIYTDGFNSELNVSNLTSGASYTFILTAYDEDGNCSEDIICEGIVPEETDGLTFTLTADKLAYIVSGFTGDASSQHVVTPEQETGAPVANPITVVVPASHNGKPVIEIGKAAFKNCHNVTKIFLPSSIKKIEKNAFEGCTGLEGVSIPENTIEINEGAFWNCSNMQWLAIPKSVESIGLGAVLGDSKLSTVFYTGTEKEWNELSKNISSGNAVLKGSVSKLINKAAEIRFEYDGITPIELTSPESVQKVNAEEGNSFVALSWTNPSDKDFNGVEIEVRNSRDNSIQVYDVPSDKDFFIVTKLENDIPYTFTLTAYDLLKNYSEPVAAGKYTPQLLEFISPDGFYYFRNTDGLTCSVSGVLEEKEVVNIPSELNNFPVTKIAEKAFFENKKLKIALIPQSIVEIGDCAFDGCENLTNIYYSSSVEQWEMIEGMEFVEADVHFNFEIVEEDDVPPAEVEINNLRHGDQKIVFDFHLPKDSDFYRIILETKEEKGNSVQVSNDCYAVTELENSVGYTFLIKTQDIYGNISEGIEIEAEAGELPFEGVTEDGFHYELCQNESELSGTSYKIVGYDVSEEEKELESLSITLPQTIHDVCVTEISAGAFDGIENLTEIIIPSTITDIEEKTFEIPSLVCVKVSTDNKVYYTNADNHILYKKSGNQKILVKVLSSVSGVLDFTGTQITEISSYCFSGCNKLTKVILPGRLMFICDNAFDNCEILSSVILPSSVKKIGKDVFENCPKFTVCYFTGNEKQLAKLSIQENYKSKLMTLIKLYGTEK